MGRPPIGKRAMTDAQRAKRYRENKKPTSTISRQRRRLTQPGSCSITPTASSRCCTSIFRGGSSCGGQTGMDRAADNHYPTMTLDEVKATTAKLPEANNCVLFMWIASELLDEIKEILAVKGFKYRGSCVWLKTGKPPGLGRWFRFKHELLIVAARGEIPAPAPGENRDSVIEAPWQGHSRKPEIFAEMIAAYYPTCPKLEMFYRPLDDLDLERVRRSKREAEGWYFWGSEAGADLPRRSGRHEIDLSTAAL